MPITVTPTPEGDALRAAAANLARSQPVAARELYHRALDTDLVVSVTLHTPPPAAPVFDRGRWVRREQRNSIPNLGIGHISASGSHRQPGDPVETMCGRHLRGTLHWDVPAYPERLAPSGWRSCETCFDVFLAVAPVTA